MHQLLLIALTTLVATTAFGQNSGSITQRETATNATFVTQSGEGVGQTDRETTTGNKPGNRVNLRVLRGTEKRSAGTVSVLIRSRVRSRVRRRQPLPTPLKRGEQDPCAFHPTRQPPQNPLAQMAEPALDACASFRLMNPMKKVLITETTRLDVTATDFIETNQVTVN